MVESEFDLEINGFNVCYFRDEGVHEFLFKTSKEKPKYLEGSIYFIAIIMMIGNLNFNSPQFYKLIEKLNKIKKQNGRSKYKTKLIAKMKTKMRHFKNNYFWNKDQNLRKNVHLEELVQVLHWVDKLQKIKIGPNNDDLQFVLKNKNQVKDQKISQMLKSIFSSDEQSPSTVIFNNYTYIVGNDGILSTVKKLDNQFLNKVNWNEDTESPMNNINYFLMNDDIP